MCTWLVILHQLSQRILTVFKTSSATFHVIKAHLLKLSIGLSESALEILEILLEGVRLLPK